MRKRGYFYSFLDAALSAKSIEIIISTILGGGLIYAGAKFYEMLPIISTDPIASIDLAAGETECIIEENGVKNILDTEFFSECDQQAFLRMGNHFRWVSVRDPATRRSTLCANTDSHGDYCAVKTYEAFMSLKERAPF